MHHLNRSRKRLNISALFVLKGALGEINSAWLPTRTPIKKKTQAVEGEKQREEDAVRARFRDGRFCRPW